MIDAVTEKPGKARAVQEGSQRLEAKILAP
jgi:hypothetical protein